jgi:hypothetical protein
MADAGMVALRDALGKILESEHGDLLREGVALVLREVMEAEVAEQAGAERYERSRSASPTATATGSGACRRGSARSSSRSPSSGRARTFRASWSQANAASRRF